MKIIGHRGASGLALENTLPSLELARLLGVDAIEFDVRMTKDNHLVLCHDNELGKVAGVPKKIDKLSLHELKKITLNDGQSTIPTLEEALQTIGNVTAIIELKVSGCVPKLLSTLDKLGNTSAIVVSRKHSEIAILKDISPERKAYLVEDTKAFEIIQTAREIKADGLDLNFWILNPLTYYLAKRHNLEIMVFTVNSRLLSKFLMFLYPDVAVCTNHPEWFVKHPWLKLRKHGLAKTRRRQKRTKSSNMSAHQQRKTHRNA